MDAIPDLVPLCDSRPGVRALVQVEIRDVVPCSAGEGGGAGAGASDATLDFIASTATLDRYHEVIEPAGWRLDAYRRNPVFQNAHNYGDILFTLGKALSTEVRAVGDRQALCQRVQFATEVNPVARIAYGLYRGGFLNAVSVGFIPLRWEDGGNGSGAADGQSAARRRYLEQELLEVSAVAIPANPDALALGVKSGAVAKADLQETLALMRSVVGATAWPGAQPEGTAGTECQPEPDAVVVNDQFFQLARELRRILRRA